MRLLIEKGANIEAERRGTMEPKNVGVLVGLPFFDTLKSLISAGNVVVGCGVPG
jgi:hypothetical protein